MDNKILSLEETNALIEANNQKFEAMTRKGKRIALAKDVISQLRAEKITAETGSYVRFDKDGLISLGLDRDYYKSDEDFAKLLVNNEKPACEVLFEESGPVTKCHACALGSLMLSAVRKSKDGDLTAGTLKQGSYSQVRDTLTEFFTTDQMYLIEAAFEMSDVHEVYQEGGEMGDDISHYYQAVEFGEKHEDDSERLIAIMQNIVENDGTFRP